VEVTLHVKRKRFDHPVGCLLLIVSWHLIDADNGIDGHLSITSFPAATVKAVSSLHTERRQEFAGQDKTPQCFPRLCEVVLTHSKF
jgi:hypothetical protein